MFGAGASYGAGPTAPSVPPLGNQLFTALQQYSALWANLPRDVAAEFNRSDPPFERGFAWTRKNADELTIPLLNHMGRYFLQFRMLQDNVYLRFFLALRRMPCELFFATLNYDMLLEEAVEVFAGSVELDPNYKGSHAVVLKLHGGPTFAISSNYHVYNNDSAYCNTAFNGPAQVLSTKELSLSRWEHDPRDAPAMALYAEGKAVLNCPKFVKTIQARYAFHVGLADEIYVVGVNYVPSESHVWQPILDARATVRIINPSTDPFIPLVAARRTQSTSLHNFGFGDFVSRMDAQGEEWFA